jgi:predicted kinase
MTDKFLIERWQKLAGILKEQKKVLEEPFNKKKIFVLIGPPSVGKSTWIENTFSGKSTPYIISRDSIVEQVASSLGWTYDDLFVTPSENSVTDDVDPKYGTVLPAPKNMPWSKMVFSKVLAANREVQNAFSQRVQKAKNFDKDIVIDMTNMTVNSRKSALQAIKDIEDKYEKIAVLFHFKGAEEMIQNLSKKRADSAKRMGKSKTIPDHVIQNMFDSFQEISPSENFDKIISVDNRALIKKLLMNDI